MKLKDQLKKIVENTFSRRDHLNLEITVTQACNCRCKYCFERESLEDDLMKCIDREEESRQLKLIEDFCQGFDVSKYEKLTITFWGGEPMLNLDFIWKIVDVTLKFDFVHYYMFTNGTLIDKFHELATRLPERECRILKNKFHFQLSYDGEPHNSVKRGSMSTKKVIETSRFLKNSGFKVSFKPTLSFDMLDSLVDIWKSYKTLHDEFGEVARYSPTLDMSCQSIQDSQLDLWRDQLIKIAKLEVDFIKQHGYPLMKNFDYGGRKACDVSKTAMMHVDGNFYVCHGCIYLQTRDQFIVGRTKDIKNLVEIYRKIDESVDLYIENQTCKHCPATYCTSCHVNYVDPKNIKSDWITCMSKDSQRCKFMKVFGLVSHALKLALE